MSAHTDPSLTTYAVSTVELGRQAWQHFAPGLERHHPPVRRTGGSRLHSPTATPPYRQARAVKL